MNLKCHSGNRSCEAFVEPERRHLRIKQVMKNRISTGTDQAELPRYKLDHQLLQQWVAGYMILPKISGFWEWTNTESHISTSSSSLTYADSHFGWLWEAVAEAESRQEPPRPCCGLGSSISNIAFSFFVFKTQLNCLCIIFVD